MKSQTVWLLLVSFLLVCGMIRGAEKAEARCRPEGCDGKGCRCTKGV